MVDIELLISNFEKLPVWQVGKYYVPSDQVNRWNHANILL